MSYEQGWERGKRTRSALRGRPWYEIEKQRDGGRWTWRIYREGFFQTQGTAPNERHADQDIEVAKADLMDRYSDWAVRCAGAAQAQESDQDDDEEEVPGQRV